MKINVGATCKQDCVYDQYDLDVLGNFQQAVCMFASKTLLSAAAPLVVP